MELGFSIICFGEDLGGNPFSKYHIMKRLSLTNKVIYIESIGVRSPKLSHRDIRRALEKLARLLQRFENSETHDETQTSLPFDVIKPLVVPFHRTVLVRWFNGHTLLRQINRYRPHHPLVLWVGLPTVPAYLLHLEPDIVIYHCADKLIANATGRDRAALECMHRFWLQRADLTLTPSEILRQELSQHSNNAQLLPHGLDYAHFARAAEANALTCPDDIAAIPVPIAGYFGTVSAEWFDTDLMSRVVAARPNIHFVVIGPIYDNIDHHPSLQHPNVHFLGPRPYEELPNYAAQFDVCMIPKVRSEMTAASMPLKLREYLATGKPIITTLQHGEPYDRHVATVHTADAFIAALDKAIAEDDPAACSARQSIVKSESWDTVVMQLSKQIASLISKEA
jgi:glycosyltransferase involved in cell wall biosynthesis